MEEKQLNVPRWSGLLDDGDEGDGSGGGIGRIGDAGGDLEGTSGVYAGANPRDHSDRSSPNPRRVRGEARGSGGGCCCCG